MNVLIHIFICLNFCLTRTRFLEGYKKIFDKENIHEAIAAPKLSSERGTKGFILLLQLVAIALEDMKLPSKANQWYLSCIHSSSYLKLDV
ncbi:hypothetical protein S83_010789 [Arachis hypogaea]